MLTNIKTTVILNTLSRINLPIKLLTNAGSTLS